MEYAERQNFYIKDILTMDGSKRSSKLNTFFTGFGRFRKIVFSTPCFQIFLKNSSSRSSPTK